MDSLQDKDEFEIGALRILENGDVVCPSGDCDDKDCCSKPTESSVTLQFCKTYHSIHERKFVHK
jgi:hypothetical protein